MGMVERQSSLFWLRVSEAQVCHGGESDRWISYIRDADICCAQHIRSERSRPGLQHLRAPPPNPFQPDRPHVTKVLQLHEAAPPPRDQQMQSLWSTFLTLTKAPEKFTEGTERCCCRTQGVQRSRNSLQERNDSKCGSALMTSRHFLS